MFTFQHSKKQSGRQPRTRGSAIYTAPSRREYVVEVISVDRRDNSAQVVYQWAKGKCVRAWVSAEDVEFVGKCRRCNGTGVIAVRNGCDDVPCPRCGFSDELVY